MDATTAKGLCILLLFLDTLLFGWPPYLLLRNNGRQSERAIQIRSTIVSYLTCFAGGVFFGACVLHLLAEGRGEMEDYFQKLKVDIKFPVFEVLVAAGFFIITLLEQLMHRFLSHSHPGVGPLQNVENKQTESDPRSSKKSGSSKSIDNPVYRIVIKNAVEDSSMTLVEGNGVTSFTDVHTDTAQCCNARPSRKEEVESGHLCCKSDHATETEANYGALNNVTAQNPSHEQDKHSNGAEVARIADMIYVNPLRAFLLLSALSFHTVFDGLAVGLQTDSVGIWEMFVAILIHKSLVALCLGMQLFLVYQSKPLKAFVWVFIFSLISPLGVGLGMILTSGNMDEMAESLVSWLLQGLATGTFMYVTFFEILWEELVNKKGILRLFVVVAGFGGMAVAKYFDKD
ncbi:zinc transporter ZIP1 [Biomphalaria pfeifferi]|uniref:Zinc transporter ZIP1 n=1 Tax=Biomphalaria pfeifferi TaxID=112525 RepID=A0AAD8BFZ1_BIOPF|nr:zinc transporter ZIP1 [Biomphalaria pfeifferi]